MTSASQTHKERIHTHIPHNLRGEKESMYQRGKQHLQELDTALEALREKARYGYGSHEVRRNILLADIAAQREVSEKRVTSTSHSTSTISARVPWMEGGFNGVEQLRTDGVAVTKSRPTPSAPAIPSTRKCDEIDGVPDSEAVLVDMALSHKHAQAMTYYRDLVRAASDYVYDASRETHVQRVAARDGQTGLPTAWEETVGPSLLLGGEHEFFPLTVDLQAVEGESLVSPRMMAEPHTPSASPVGPLTTCSSLGDMQRLYSPPRTRQGHTKLARGSLDCNHTTAVRRLTGAARCTPSTVTMTAACPEEHRPVTVQLRNRITCGAARPGRLRPPSTSNALASVPPRQTLATRGSAVAVNYAAGFAQGALKRSSVVGPTGASFDKAAPSSSAVPPPPPSAPTPQAHAPIFAAEVEFPRDLHPTEFLTRVVRPAALVFCTACRGPVPCEVTSGADTVCPSCGACVSLTGILSRVDKLGLLEEAGPNVDAAAVTSSTVSRPSHNILSGSERCDASSSPTGGNRTLIHPERVSVATDCVSFPEAERHRPTNDQASGEVATGPQGRVSQPAAWGEAVAGLYFLTLWDEGAKHMPRGP